MARVFARERTFLDPVCRPLERLVYRLTGVDELRDMRWTEYAVALLLFSVVSMLVLYAMQRLQYYLPYNPQGFTGVPPDLAFNTAASFTTNTNWQAYSGESTMSYFTQMAGLAYHNFVSAAAGIAVAIAFIRGIAQQEEAQSRESGVDLHPSHASVASARGAVAPESAILSAVIFNALIIVGLVPLALRGVKYRPEGAAVLLRRNLLIYGVGGVIIPFIGIKAIDVLITTIGLA